jgi:hypothetical protein
MQDLWTNLAERTQSWQALGRQHLADAIWAPYVISRFERTGDERALQFVYPYLKSTEPGKRRQAIQVAARIFEGRGPGAIADLDYFTQNTDPYIRDRAPLVIAGAMHGYPGAEILTALKPYLGSSNEFTRRTALKGACRAAPSDGHEAILAELQAADTINTRKSDIEYDVALLFAGRPTEETYRFVTREGCDEEALGALLDGASSEWFERARREHFLDWIAERGRWAIEGYLIACRGRGHAALEPILPHLLREIGRRGIIGEAARCFTGSDISESRAHLLDLVRTGDVAEQRFSAICLGRLLFASEDPDAIKALLALCQSRNGAVRAAGMLGVAMVAKSTANQELGSICEKGMQTPETARAAVCGFGLLYQGSGRHRAFEALRTCADAYRNRPVQGRKHYRPLAESYGSVGRIYQGTGSPDPVDYLLDAVAPSPVQWSLYRWAAARALLMVESPWSTLNRIYRGEEDWLYGIDSRWWG